MSVEPPVFAPSRSDAARTGTTAYATGATSRDDAKDVADAEWLYAWSLRSLRAAGGTIGVRVTPPG